MTTRESQSEKYEIQGNSARATAPSDSPHDHSRIAPSDPAASPVCQPRPCIIPNRISFGRPGGMKDLAIKDLEKRKRAEKAEAQARKDAASRERKARRDHEEKNRKERRKASKERAKQNKEDKALKHAEEKRVKDYYGIRGYDPNAGMLRSNREGDGGARAGEGTKAGQARQGPPTQTFHAKETWGFEYGKPKQHDGKGHFSGHHKNCGEHYGSSAAAIDDGD